MLAVAYLSKAIRTKYGIIVSMDLSIGAKERKLGEILRAVIAALVHQYGLFKMLFKFAGILIHLLILAGPKGFDPLTCGSEDRRDILTTLRAPCTQ